MRVILLALLLSSCGLVTVKKYDTIVERGVDSAFFSYVDAFETLSSKKVHGQIAMWFNVEVEEGRVGECDPTTREVRIRWKDWNDMTNAEHENIVFHELAHCLLDRQHNEETATIQGVENAPVSLMYPKTIDTETYKKLRAYYHQELFGRMLPDKYYTSEAFP